MFGQIRTEDLRDVVAIERVRCHEPGCERTAEIKIREGDRLEDELWHREWGIRHGLWHCRSHVYAHDGFNRDIHQDDEHKRTYQRELRTPQEFGGFLIKLAIRDFTRVIIQDTDKEQLVRRFAKENKLYPDYIKITSSGYLIMRISYVFADRFFTEDIREALKQAVFPSKISIIDVRVKHDD